MRKVLDLVKGGSVVATLLVGAAWFHGDLSLVPSALSQAAIVSTPEFVATVGRNGDDYGYRYVKIALKDHEPLDVREIWLNGKRVASLTVDRYDGGWVGLEFPYHLTFGDEMMVTCSPSIGCGHVFEVRIVASRGTSTYTWNSGSPRSHTTRQ